MLDPGRSERHALLLVLLAKQAVPVLRAEILRFLEKHALFGSVKAVDDLLSWMPRHLRRRQEKLALRYFELARQLLFVDCFAPTQLVSLEEFSSWSWRRRLLALVTWFEGRSAARGAPRQEGTSSPALDATRIEFELSRGGQFRRLRRDGGAVARILLDRMAYRDLCSPRGLTPLSSVMLTLGLALILSAPSAFLAYREWSGWNQGNRRFAQEVRSFRESFRLVPDLILEGHPMPDVDGGGQ